MASETIGRFFTLRMADARDQFPVTRKAGVLSNVAVEWDNPNRFLEGARRKGEAVPEPVDRFDRVLGQDVIVGGVAIVVGGARIRPRRCGTG